MAPATEAFRTALTRRLGAGLVIALGIVAVTGYVALRSHQRLNDAWHMVTRTHEILEGLDRLLGDMVDVETGQRGFVITGEESYLEPLEIATERVAADLARLEEMIQDERARKLLREVEPSVERKLTHSLEVVALRRSSGFAPAAEMIATDRGKQTMDEIRRLVDAMRAREHVLRVQRTTAAESEALFADRLFIAGSLISGLMIGAIIFVLRREVIERQSTAVELRRHSATSDAILKNMADGVVVAGPDGDILLMNPGAERLLGHSAGHTRFDPEDERESFVFLPDGTTPYPRDQLALACALRGERVDAADCVLQMPGSPDPTWVTVSARPLQTAEGTRLGAVAIFRDVSAMKRAELALQERNATLRDSIEKLERRNEEVSLLGELSGLLQACLGEEEASSIIARSLVRLFPDSRGAIYLLNPSRNLVFAGALWGEPPPEEQTFAPDDCWGLRRGRVHTLDRTKLALPCGHVGADVEGSVCVPLMAQGDALGVLHIRVPARESTPANEIEPRLLHAVADEVGLALANLRLRDSLRQQSIRDPLTNLFNRRYMEESFERELQRAVRKSTPIGVLMIDVDHFKSFNDSYGHDAGDALLCELGAAFKSSVRGEDLACRFGGEEFVVILPDATLDDCVRRAELVRSKAKGIVVHHGDRNLRTVTLSIGVAVYPEHGHEARSLVQAADRALYRAKSEGRDRVVVASVPGGQSAATAA